MNPADDFDERYLRGELGAAELAAFEQRLRGDEAARAAFRRAARLNANLHSLATEQLDEVAAWSPTQARTNPLARAEQTFPTPILSLLWRSVAPLAAVLVVAMGVWFARRPVPSPLAAEASAAGYAVITAQADVRWDGGRKFADGDLLAGEALRMAGGIARLDFFSGATVIVEGPAEFQVVSPMEMWVSSGKVRAHVPEAAQGFRLRTAQGDVVDLGTEFAVDADATRSDLHVLDGGVEWHPLRDSMRALKSGEGLRWAADGTSAPLAANGLGFISAAELERRTTVSRAGRRAGWLAFSETLRRDPRLVAYYTMDAPTGGSDATLPDRAESAGHAAIPGAIVAAARDADRWGHERGALDFRRTGSRVRVAVPGEFRSLTLLCWVKINSLDRRFNSLFLTDGFDLHEPHWQIHDDGRLVFVIKGHMVQGWDKQMFFSPPIWEPSASGQWMMIVTVFDADAGRVTHFTNGNAISQESIPSHYLTDKLSIGASSIGNWNLPIDSDPTFAIRNLNGSMDEFALFAAALTSAEIAEIYEHAKP